jgi:hypothetical protein
MFVARSAELPALVKVTDVLFRFAADPKLRREFLGKRR